MNNKKVCVPWDAYFFAPVGAGNGGYCSAEAEKQNDHGDQNDPKQNVFAEKIACAVHSVTPFFDTE